MHNLVNKVILILVLLCIFLSLTSNASDDVKVIQLIEDAKVAQKKAASVDGEWRDVAEILEKAEQAINSGDLDKAKELAELAKFQSELGYQQAVDQKGNVEHPSILR
ncbi:MAG: hypothetical protein R8G33_01265 [Gammaproteobacteria bacterium]|nr:hypothetical protein [Gammaproteobacteria bacterium]